MSTQQTPPEVLWAQRSSSTDTEKNYITLTINAPDTSKPEIDLKPTSLTFTGHSETKKTTYHVELEFFGEIDVENSKTHATSANIYFVLRKKDLKEEYWPRLLKESKRVHYLKTDFDKWVDEDEQDGAPDDLDAGMGGGMPDMGGMGGMGGDGGFGGIDFSKLGGGAGGMPDMSAMGDMGDLGGGGDDVDDADDDDMPDLEDEAGEDKDNDVAGKAAGKAADEEAVPEGKGKAKIEEVS